MAADLGASAGNHGHCVPDGGNEFIARPATCQEGNAVGLGGEGANRLGGIRAGGRQSNDDRVSGDARFCLEPHQEVGIVRAVDMWEDEPQRVREGLGEGTCSVRGM